MSTVIPVSVSAAVLNALGIDPLMTAAHLAGADRRQLAHAMVEWPLPVTGSRGYNHAEATAGGVSLTEINPATMASRVCPDCFS